MTTNETYYSTTMIESCFFSDEDERTEQIKLTLKRKEMSFLWLNSGSYSVVFQEVGTKNVYAFTREGILQKDIFLNLKGKNFPRIEYVCTKRLKNNIRARVYKMPLYITTDSNKFLSKNRTAIKILCNIYKNLSENEVYDVTFPIFFEKADKKIRNKILKEDIIPSLKKIYNVLKKRKRKYYLDLKEDNFVQDEQGNLILLDIFFRYTG